MTQTKELSDLELERKRASFPTRQMSFVLFGGESRLQRREAIRKRIQSDPAFDNKDRIHMSRAELYRHGLKQVARLEEVKADMRKAGEEITFEVNCVLSTEFVHG